MLRQRTCNHRQGQQDTQSVCMCVCVCAETICSCHWQFCSVALKAFAEIRHVVVFGPHAAAGAARKSHKYVCHLTLALAHVCASVCATVCVLCLSICYLNALHFWPPLNATPRPAALTCPAVNFRQEFSQHFMLTTECGYRHRYPALTQFQQLHVRWQRQSRNVAPSKRAVAVYLPAYLAILKLNIIDWILNLDKFKKQLLFYHPKASLTLTTLAVAQVSNCLELISASSHASESNQSQFPPTFHTLFPNALTEQTLWRPADAVKFNKNHWFWLMRHLVSSKSNSASSPSSWFFYFHLATAHCPVLVSASANIGGRVDMWHVDVAQVSLQLKQMKRKRASWKNRKEQLLQLVIASSATFTALRESSTHRPPTFALLRLSVWFINRGTSQHQLWGIESDFSFWKSVKL